MMTPTLDLSGYNISTGATSPTGPTADASGYNIASGYTTTTTAR